MSEEIKGRNSNSMLVQMDFPMGCIVYIRTDKDQQPYMITGILLTLTGSLQYRIDCGLKSDWAYGVQLSDTKEFVL